MSPRPPRASATDMVERILLMAHIAIEKSRQGEERRLKRIVWIELQANGINLANRPTAFLSDGVFLPASGTPITNSVLPYCRWKATQIHSSRSLNSDVLCSLASALRRDTIGSSSPNFSRVARPVFDFSDVLPVRSASGRIGRRTWSTSMLCQRHIVQTRDMFDRPDGMGVRGWVAQPGLQLLKSAEL